MIKHGNGHLDHCTTSVKGSLERIYQVKRQYRERPFWTKNLRNGDIIIGYVDPGENTTILEKEIIYQES